MVRFVEKDEEFYYSESNVEVDIEYYEDLKEERSCWVFSFNN